MNSKKNVQKDLLQQITYLSRLIEQKTNVASRRLVHNSSGGCHSVSTPCSDVKNKYKLCRLNNAKSQVESAISHRCDNSSLSYTKFKVLNRKINAPKKPTSHTASRRHVVQNDSVACHSVSKCCSGVKNKYVLSRLNNMKGQVESSISHSCDNSSSSSSCTKLKMLNKKINAPKKSIINDNKIVTSNSDYRPAKPVDASVTIAVKNSIHVNRTKLFDNVSIKKDSGNQTSKNCLHINRAKLQLKCDKNGTELSDVHHKMCLKKVIHINPKFNKSAISKGEVKPISLKRSNSTESSYCNTSCDENQDVKCCNGSLRKIHFNKEFIAKKTVLYNVNKLSKSTSDKSNSSVHLLLPQSIKNSNWPPNKLLDSPPDETYSSNSSTSNVPVKSESKTCSEMLPEAASFVVESRSSTFDNSSSNTVEKSLSGNILGMTENLLKLKKSSLKDLSSKSVTPKQFQYLLHKNLSVKKNLSSLLVRKYKNRNKLININRSASITTRKLNSCEINKLLCSKKLVNSGSKDCKVINKSKQPPQRLQPVLKRSNSNSKLLKLVKLSNTKLIRAKSDLSKTNQKSLKICKSSKINQNSLNIKGNKRVWIAPGNKNLQSNVDNKKPKNTIDGKLSSSYKYNSKFHSSTNKHTYVKVNTPLKTSEKIIVNPSNSVTNQNDLTLCNLNGKCDKNQRISIRRKSQNSNLVSLSRTKLIRKSNLNNKSKCGNSEGAQKVCNLWMNRQLSLNNKSFRLPLQTKLTPALRTARLVKTKYKLIRNLNLNRTRMNWSSVCVRSEKVNFSPNLKTKINKGITRSSSRRRRKSVTIGGINYHSSNTKLRRKFPTKEGKVYTNKIFRNKGQSYNVSRGGRSLNRINSSEIRRRLINRISRSNSVYSYNALPRTTDFARNKVVQAKQRSIALLTRKFRKSNEPCLIFNRLGRCSGQERGVCNRLHDRKRIAICKKFLQGTCEKKACLLSHDVGPSKMPTCRHYLAGVCVRDDCPYLHVKVNSSAPICVPFLQGYCPDAQKCKKRHIAMCPEYEDKGICSKGKSCPYPHPKCKKFVKEKHLDVIIVEQTKTNNNNNQEPNPEEVSETDTKLNRYYFAQENDVQNQFVSLKRKSDDNDECDESLAGSDWLRKRPRIGDLPGYIPLDKDTELSQ